MKEKNTLRDRWLTIRLSKEEETALLKLCKKTTCRNLSEYGRKVLLKEPVIVRYRNASADDFFRRNGAFKKGAQRHRQQLQSGRSPAAYVGENTTGKTVATDE